MATFKEDSKKKIELFCNNKEESEECRVSKDVDKIERKSEATAEKEKTLIKCPKPNVVINVANTTGDLHLGSRITINSPVYLKGITRDDVITFNDNCNCDQKMYKGCFNQSNCVNNVRMQFLKNLKPIHCFIVGILVIIVCGLILSLLKYNPTNNEISCNGITMSHLIKLNKNLTNFVHRHEWERIAKSEYDIKYVNTSLNNNCSFTCNVTTKFKVRFVTLNDIWLTCANGSTDCSMTLRSELKRNLYDLPINLHDIYYNYIITPDGRIYEGRSLLCPFDEADLPEDHTSVLIVGIPYCFPAKSKRNSVHKTKVSIAIQEILKKLLLSKILTENYRLEFPRICANYSQSLFNIKNEIIIYDNDTLNIPSLWNKNVIRDLLFLPDYTINGIDLNNNTNEIKFHPDLMTDLTDFNSCSSFSGTPYFKRLDIRLFLLKVKVKLEKYCSLDVKDCEYYNDYLSSVQLKFSMFPESINYQINFPNNSSKGYPINFCYLTQSKYEYYKRHNFYEVTIMILDGFSYLHRRIEGVPSWNDEYIVTKLSKMTKDFAKDIRRYINYSEVRIVTQCGRSTNGQRGVWHFSWVTSPLLELYDMLTDSVKDNQEDCEFHFW